MLRYLSRRREQGRDGTEQWRTIDPLVGDEQKFRETVDWRNRKRRKVSYMTLVISPERDDLELTDDEFRRLAQFWTVNANGKTEQAVGYVHRDTGHPHLHLAVARHYYSRAEMERNHEATREYLRDIERARDLERSMDRVFEAELDRAREGEREAERRADQEPEPDREPERDAAGPWRMQDPAQDMDEEERESDYER